MGKVFRQTDGPTDHRQWEKKSLIYFQLKWANKSKMMLDRRTF